jgi:hypothetical protein
MAEIIGYIQNLVEVYKFFEEIFDQKIFMNWEHRSDGENLTIKFTAVDTTNWGPYLFKRFILLDSSKPWHIMSKNELKKDDLKPSIIDKFGEIIVKFPKTNSGKDAYNTMVNAYHNHDLISQFKVLSYLKHLCDPNASSFRLGNASISKLSTQIKPMREEDMTPDGGWYPYYFTNLKMELSIS